MVFNFSKYSFRGIQDLCRKYHRQIVASPDKNNLKSVLDGRRVRFINPLGEFDYAYFGEFTFDGDVIILLTKDHKYTKFHKPLHLSTLWSMVPVIFAGVDTRFKDDQYQEIFTGDVVSYKGYTSFVRYFSDSLVPSLAGDNCDVQFERNGDMHKEGTVFSNIKPTLFKGDIGTRWEDMAAQITAGVNFSMCGVPFWSMDIGGFCVEKRYEEAQKFFEKTIFYAI